MDLLLERAASGGLEPPLEHARREIGVIGQEVDAGSWSQACWRISRSAVSTRRILDGHGVGQAPADDSEQLNRTGPGGGASRS